MLTGIEFWIAVILVGSTATWLLLTSDWRWGLGLLGVQYLGAAVLVGQHWPFGMAAAKLVAGWMATTALGMTLTAKPRIEKNTERLWSQGLAFRLFMAGMIYVLTSAITPRIDLAVGGVGSPVIAGTILLAGLGFLQLGTSSQIIKVIFGLLTILSGFEVFYAAVESSILVAGFLAIVTLGIGLLGAYLLNASDPEDVI